MATLGMRGKIQNANHQWRATAQGVIGLLAAGAYLLYANWDRVAGALNSLWQCMGRSFPAVLASISSTITNWSPIGLFYRAFAGVLSWFGIELPGKFTEFGANMISGLITGILSMASMIKSAIGSIADTTIGWFKDKLGIRSPSRVFMVAGANVSQGAAMGISSGYRQVRQAAAGLTLAASSSPMLASDDMRFDSRPAIGSRPASAVAAPRGGDHFHLHLPASADPHEIQRLINAALDERDRKQAAKRRSALRDTD